MKNKFWVFALGVMVLVSCKERGPAINFADVQPDPDDTTYVLSSVPAAQPRNVYVEEFTGVSCPNCPAGHDILKSLQAASPNRIVAISYYPKSNLLTYPRPGTNDDFRLAIADTFNSSIYGGGANNLPIAGVDRMKYSGNLLLVKELWSSTVSDRLNVPSPVKLEATTTYDETSKNVKVKITATFTSAISKKVYITAGMYQDSIIDAQEDQTGGDIEDYVHNHVLRKLITPNSINGLELGTTGSYEAGRVYVRSFTTAIDDVKWIPEDCGIFIVVHHMDGETKEVLQATSVHVK